MPLANYSSGQPYYQTFCIEGLHRDQGKYASACIAEHELKKAAGLQRQWAEDNNATEIHASMCFMEGHCTNTQVTEKTTAEEAIAMCDKRYSRAGWTAMFAPAVTGKMRLMMGSKDGRFSQESGVTDQHISKYMQKMACAQGTYHCDVMTCKQTYCKEEKFMSKYGYLQPDKPGHELRQSSWMTMGKLE